MQCHIYVQFRMFTSEEMEAKETKQQTCIDQAGCEPRTVYWVPRDSNLSDVWQQWILGLRSRRPVQIEEHITGNCLLPKQTTTKSSLSRNSSSWQSFRSWEILSLARQGPPYTTPHYHKITRLPPHTGQLKAEHLEVLSSLTWYPNSGLYFIKEKVSVYF